MLYVIGDNLWAQYDVKDVQYAAKACHVVVLTFLVSYINITLVFITLHDLHLEYATYVGLVVRQLGISCLQPWMEKFETQVCKERSSSIFMTYTSTFTSIHLLIHISDTYRC